MDEPRSLLIVEDHEATRQTLRRLLAGRGWQVQVAATVGEALRLLDGQAPQCVVLDLMLPDGPGEQVLRLLRTEKRPTRVIVTTAVGDEGRLEGVRSLNPDAIVEKPIEMNSFLRLCEPPGRSRPA